MTVTRRFVIPCPYCKEHRPDNLMPMHLNAVHPELSRIQIVAIVERGIRHAQERHQLADIDNAYSPWRLILSAVLAVVLIAVVTALALTYNPPEPQPRPHPTPTVWTPTP